MAGGSVASVAVVGTSIAGVVIARGTAQTHSAIMSAATTANRIPPNDKELEGRINRKAYEKIDRGGGKLEK